MTDSANELLNAFDALPPNDRREVAAEELFLELDAAEGDHGQS